ncbi:MAG: hypothetical protein JZU53_06485 [Paludibacter sp.]|nr:hypothetical protein [Paludibacter sp.]
MSRKLLLTLSLFLITISTLFGQSKFQNDLYGFGGQVPDDWHVYGELKDDLTNKRAIIDWGLPKVYSELEKTSIENSVSITAYKRPSLKSIDDLTKFEFGRVANVLVSKELIDSTSYIVFTVRNGLKFKSKLTFVFKNEVGYVLNFTATPGTYDINLSKFDNFVRSLQIFKPKD